MKLVYNLIFTLLLIGIVACPLQAEFIKDFEPDSLEYQLLIQLEDPRLAMKSKLAKAKIAPVISVPVSKPVEIKSKTPTTKVVVEPDPIIEKPVSIVKVTPPVIDNKKSEDFQEELNLKLAEQKATQQRYFEAKLTEQKAELDRYYSNKLREAESSLAKRDQEIDRLRSENRKAQAEVARVKLEAKETEERLKRDLLISITEVESLSNILEDFNRATLGQKPIDRKKEAKKVVAQERPQPPKNVDLPILKVSVDKANLRTGPGTNHAPLMELAKGSRLVVEKRSGSWFRVIAPNGVRAWISSEVTEMMPSDFGNNSSVEVAGYQDEAEQRALRILRGGR